MCFVKPDIYEILQNLHESTCAGVSFLKGYMPPASSLIQKETLAFFGEFFEIFKNAWFYRTPLLAASVFISIREQISILFLTFLLYLMTKILGFFCRLK